MTDLIETHIFGGTGGNEFNDWFAAPTHSIRAITGLTIRTGSLVDAILPTYRLASGGTYSTVHGGTGGTADVLTLAAGERIFAVSGRSGTMIDQLLVHVVSGSGPNPTRRTIGGAGGGGGNPFVIFGEPVAFIGRSGSMIDALGMMIKVRQSPMAGGGGGGAFFDPQPVPGATRLGRIVVGAGMFVDSIATDYVGADGSVTTITHGGSGGSPNEVRIAPNERIVRVFGRSGAFLDSLGFVIEDLAGNKRTAGPFGGQGGSAFSMNGNVLSFFGRSGSVIDAIGCVVT